MDFDDEGVAIPGSYAIATTLNGGAFADGWPVITTTVAVCDVCGGWASELRVVHKRTTHPAADPETLAANWNVRGFLSKRDAFANLTVSRTVQVIVYACPEHIDTVADGLVKEFGYASNFYEPDDLALAVIARRRAHQHSVDDG